MNTPDLQGRTPLIWAAMKGYLELAGTLIDYGASISVTDQYGKDAQVIKVQSNDIAHLLTVVRPCGSSSTSEGNEHHDATDLISILLNILCVSI